jgi:threonine dehydrogenase-like Zn-dependent dehydrogenase
VVLKELRGCGKIWGVEYPQTDLYFEVSGARGVLSQIADFSMKRSRIIMVAMQRDPVTFDGTRLMSKEITLIGASGYPTEFPEVMGELAAKSVDPEAMITHRFAFTDFLQAFEVANDANHAAKVLLTFD